MKGYVNFNRSKTNASLISVIQRIADMTSTFLSGYLTCIFFDVSFYYQPLIISFVLMTYFQLIGGITDFYRSWRGVNFSTELIFTFQNWGLAILLAIGTCFLISSFNIPPLFFVGWLLTFIVLDLVMRFIIRYLAGYFRSLGYNKRTVVIAGDMPVGKKLIDSFNDQPWLGFEVIGYYTQDATQGNRLGDYEQLIADAKKGGIDRIYLAFNMADKNELDWLVKELADTTCSVMLIPDIFTYNILHCRTEEINGIPVVPLFETPINGINKILKRMEDIIFSFGILVLISPALLVISIMVKLTSPGPVFFIQKRYGMDGKAIKILKFRTMRVMEDGDDVKQAIKNDIRVTPIGRFLRRTSLDELPQFINVLFGSMSIVGPRPHAVAHNEQYRMLIKGYMLRHKVKPGITGWAQINGWRGETDTLEKMEKRVEFDLEYIRQWSLWLDVKIIFLTVFKGFVGSTAY